MHDDEIEEVGLPDIDSLMDSDSTQQSKAAPPRLNINARTPRKPAGAVAKRRVPNRGKLISKGSDQKSGAVPKRTPKLPIPIIEDGTNNTNKKELFEDSEIDSLKNEALELDNLTLEEIKEEVSENNKNLDNINETFEDTSLPIIDNNDFSFDDSQIDLSDNEVDSLNLSDYDFENISADEFEFEESSDDLPLVDDGDFEFEPIDDETQADDHYNYSDFQFDDTESNDETTELIDDDFNPDDFDFNIADEKSISDDDLAFLDIENMSDEEFERLIEEEALKNGDFDDSLDDELNNEELDIDSEELAENTESEEDDEIEEEKPKKKRKKSKKGLLALLLIPLRWYLAFSRLVWGSISSILNFLGKLPIVGRLFRLSNKILKITPDFAKDMILPAVPVLAVSFGVLAVPGANTELELPDDGGAKISNISYDDKTITAEIENTGDIIAHVLPEFVVRKTNIANPLTWFNPEEIGVCKADEVSIGIGETSKIESTCDFEHPGGVVKVDGLLS